MFNDIITSVAEGQFLPEGAILTSSTDLCVCLWKMDGTKIGTFGQRKKWNLNDPFTWASQLPAEQLHWNTHIKTAKYARSKLKSNVKMRWCNVSGPIVVSDRPGEVTGPPTAASKQRLSMMANTRVDDDGNEERQQEVAAAAAASKRNKKSKSAASITVARGVTSEPGELEATDAEVKAAALYRSLALRDGREETPEVVDANIWVRLPCHGLQGIPQSHRSFMHRSTREKQSRRKKKNKNLRQRMGKAAF